MGELGFLTPKNRRTQTVECIENGEVLTITYDKLLELYFQNPEFGYCFLRLTSERMLQNIARLEGVVAENKAKLEAIKAPEPSRPSIAQPANRMK
jgi:CRP-like cAMP-binding protein